LNITETNRRIAEQCNEAFDRGDLDAQQLLRRGLPGGEGSGTLEMTRFALPACIAALLVDSTSSHLEHCT
jgi:hypothetical protein